MEFTLTKKQQAIYDAIEGSEDNFLLLGKPGVGKSVLINTLLEKGKKNYAVAAPTGLAAINVNGKTLHSLFKIPVFENGIIPLNINLPSHRDLAGLYRVQHLIIDEISMVRADLLDYIDRVLKHFRNNDKPFGGIQLIMVGDFCQLPPVCRAEDKKELKAADYQSEFAFSAHSFQLEDFKIFELTEVLRQKGDLYFMEILNGARFGTLTRKMINDLNALVGVAKPLTITLAATNKQADEINSNELSRLPSPAVRYEYELSGEWPEQLWPLSGTIILKVGAQVLVRKNGADRPADHEGDFASKLVNGHLGVIKAIEKDYILLEDGNKVYKQTFQRTRKAEQPDGTWKNEVWASFTQMPLIPAWSISMHKSQGQSFERVNIDPSKVFAAGQLYVALSRARSMSGMTLLSPVELRKFTVNPMVKLFYESL